MSLSLLALTLLVSCSGVAQKHKGSEVISSCIPCENRQLGAGKGPSGACAGGRILTDSLLDVSLVTEKLNCETRIWRNPSGCS